MSRWVVLFAAAVVQVLPATASGTGTPAPVEAPLSSAQLVSAVESVSPGRPFYLGVWITLAPGWHTYWRNPGDSGLAPAITLRLPEGWKAGDMLWPAPTLFPDPPLVSYGYAGSVLLPIRIEPPAQATTGETVRIEADLAWLICRETCVPFEAKLALELPVRAEHPAPAAAWIERFTLALLCVPVPDPAWSFSAETRAGRLRIRVTPPADVSGSAMPSADLLAMEPGLVEPASKTTWRQEGAAWITELSLVNAAAPPTRFAGVLLLHPETPPSHIEPPATRAGTTGASADGDAGTRDESRTPKPNDGGPASPPASRSALAFEVSVVVHP
jgi:thiol:disulfide interchange protein DsbD